MFKKIKDIFLIFDNTNLFWKLRKLTELGGYKALIIKFLYYLIESKNNSFIPLSAVFDNKPAFPHGIKGIFISCCAKIGTNAVIFHQVNIGSNNLSDAKRKGAPTIGDNVYIGCGAKIIGNIKIGNNVRIGANCVVCDDIPDNSTVVMPKPRIIKKDKVMNNSFIQWGENT